MDLTGAERALIAEDEAALRDELLRLLPQAPDREIVDELIGLALYDPIPPSWASTEVRAYVETLAETQRRLDAAKRGTPAPRRARRLIGAEIDFIAELGGAEGWTILHCLNYLQLGRLKPRRRAAAVGTVRDDGIYILEWIAYYRVLGFEHMFIYTNDNCDGSELLLRRLADHGVITLIESETSGEVPPEVKAFGHALHLLHELRDFEWAFFVDSDEYLVPAPRFGASIHAVLDALETERPEHRVSAICYDWLWYVSGMAYTREPGLLIQRFQHARPHWLTKTIVRVADLLSMRRQHFPELKAGCAAVDSSFAPLDLQNIWNRRVPQYAGGRVNHYWPKSFEEFWIKKARGQTLKLEQNEYDRPFRKFFEWNGYETAESHVPFDRGLIAAVQAEIDAMLTLDDIAALSQQIEDYFPHLVARYRGDGSLRDIYEHSRTDPTAL